MKKLMIAVAAGAFLLTACSDRDRVTENIKKVKTVVPVRASSEGLISFPAKVVSDNKINVSFKLSGRILSTAVEEGATVTKGQLISSLDPRDYRIAYEAALAEYNSIKSEADRVIALYGDSATSAVNYDKAVYGLQQITAKLDHARDQLGDTKIYAPVSGTVKTVYRRGGEVVGAGMPVVEIVDDGRPVVEIKIPASDYMRRNEFDGYSCRFDVYPDRLFRLEPLSFSSVANANQLYTVKLGFAGGQNPLPSVGMTTSVEISVGEPTVDSGSWIVPSSAITGNRDSAYIYILPADSLLRQVPVTVERLNGNGDAVIGCDEPLDGRQVVAAGAGSLRGGQKAVPVAAESKSNVGGLL